MTFMKLNRLNKQMFELLFCCCFIYPKVMGNGWMRVAVNIESSSISTGSIWGGGGGCGVVGV